MAHLLFLYSPFRLIYNASEINDVPIFSSWWVFCLVCFVTFQFLAAWYTVLYILSMN